MPPHNLLLIPKPPRFSVVVDSMLVAELIARQMRGDQRYAVMSAGELAGIVTFDCLLAGPTLISDGAAMLALTLGQRRYLVRVEGFPPTGT